jgi:hypothetical protein
MSDDELWKRRFRTFLAIRLVAWRCLAGMRLLFRPSPAGGNGLLGGLLATGALDAMIAPRILKRRWEQQDR